ncbi:MAG: hypothetical protein AB7G39_07720 [Alphaproteobacteria bacterium]
MQRFLRILWVFALCASVLGAGPARAQQAPGPAGEYMTATELQSLACIGVGTVTALSTTVLVFMSPLEFLNAPVVAGAFAAGCGVGAIVAPGVYWIARRLYGEAAPDAAPTAGQPSAMPPPAAVEAPR